MTLLLWGCAWHTNNNTLSNLGTNIFFLFFFITLLITQLNGNNMTIMDFFLLIIVLLSFQGLQGLLNWHNYTYTRSCLVHRLQNVQLFIDSLINVVNIDHLSIFCRPPCDPEQRADKCHLLEKQLLHSECTKERRKIPTNKELLLLLLYLQMRRRLHEMLWTCKLGNTDQSQLWVKPMRQPTSNLARLGMNEDYFFI